MTDFWQNLLQEQETISTLSDLQPPCFIPLGNMGVLSVSGNDAESFLQNLLTNDVSKLAINQAQRTGFCNAKGRLFAIFILVRIDNGYQLILPKSMTALLHQRLNMYILRSKVTITDESEALSCIGIISKNVKLADSGEHIRYPGDTERYIRLCKQTDIENDVSNYKQLGLEIAPQACWNQRDIEQGLAMIWPATKELFTPQQVNFDLVNGVSFSKGCYPGQEIVARLHYLGSPSRRLFVAKAQTNLSAAIAEEIHDKKGHVAGHIVSVQHTEQNLALLLSLKLASSSASLFLENGTQLDVQALANEEII